MPARPGSSVAPDLLVRGGRVVDPSQQLDSVADVYVSGGRVTGLGRRPDSSADEYLVIDATGLVVSPGFIDVHCHLREPGFEEKETIATGTRAAARGGFTTVCCMPNTEPPLDSVAAVEGVLRLAASGGLIRVLPVGCVTRGRAGIELADFGELSISGVIGFSDDGAPVADAEIMRRALECARDLDLPVIDHCEDLALSEGGVVNEGPVAERLGLKGIPPAAEANMVYRDIDLAGSTGGRIHIAHVSTAESVYLVRRAKEQGVAVTAEVTPHHLTLTEELAAGGDSNAKVNPPLRGEYDLAALVRGLEEGIIDFIATDHAPLTEADKSCGFEAAAFGISGFETALGSLMGLVHNGEIDLPALIASLACKPAAFLRRPDLGTLKLGSTADVVVFDPYAEWVVNPDDFASKGRNTPLAGSRLKGRVVVTVSCGVVVYSIEGACLGGKSTNS